MKKRILKKRKKSVRKRKRKPIKGNREGKERQRMKLKREITVTGRR